MKYIYTILILSLYAFANQGTIMIHIKYDKGSYNILRAWKIDKTFPATISKAITQLNENDIIVQVKDKKSKIVDNIILDNPSLITNTEIDDNDGTFLHKEMVNDQTTFIVRYPYSEKLMYLSVLSGKDVDIEKSIKGPLKKNNIVVYAKQSAQKSKTSNNNIEFASLLK